MYDNELLFARMYTSIKFFFSLVFLYAVLHRLLKSVIPPPIIVWSWGMGVC